MEVRVLRYFLTVVREESITKAAEVLHITQPTLSRQLAQLEGELGVTLFSRGTRKISLTSEGMLLKRRAEEILELVDKTEQEMARQEELVEGTVAVGCGDLLAVQTLGELIRSFIQKYPRVTFDLYTATADHIKERMDRGVTDIGLLLEPVEMDKYEHIRLNRKESWGVAMRPDDPLAGKEKIRPEDLKGRPLILPRRLSLQSELASWRLRGLQGASGPFHQQSQLQQQYYGVRRPGIFSGGGGVPGVLGSGKDRVPPPVSGSFRHQRAGVEAESALCPGGGEIYRPRPILTDSERRTGTII